MYWLSILEFQMDTCIGKHNYQYYNLQFYAQKNRSHDEMPAQSNIIKFQTLTNKKL